jgi:agmatinase
MAMGQESLSDFDVNGPGLPGKLFGLPFTPEDARLVILPIPWEATVSYRTGTSKGPEAILKASRQIDFFSREIPDAWKMGVTMTEVPQSLLQASDRLRILVDQYHNNPIAGDGSALIPNKINETCENLHIYVKNLSLEYLRKGKLVALVGGDHSTPLGLIRALSETHERFAVLQIDAHADLRKAYEGFTYSHGSIMYNVLKMPSIQKLVQVGVRDFCEAEYQLIQRAGGRIRTFFDDDIKAKQHGGQSWEAQCTDIIKELPQKVYISFDIDGLDPRFCPHTGTPVPGGLEFHHAVDLIRAVATSGRTIIGFDLNEVAPGDTDDWDANVGARLLWQLSCWTGVANGFLNHSRISR